MPASTTAPDKPARRRRHDVDSLVDVAVRVFAENGYDGTSMEDLATAAGITKSSIYHHVSSKEELLERGIDRALAFMLRTSEEVEEDARTVEEALRGITRRVVELAVAQDPNLTLMRRLPMMTSTAPWAMQRYYAFEQVAAATVDRAVEEGVLRDDIDPLLLNRLLWLMVTAIADARRLDPSLSVDELTEIGLDVVLTGARARDAS